MVILKIKRDTQGGLPYLRNAISYLEDDEKSLFTGGFGVTTAPIEETYRQMVAVRKYFGKVSGNPLIHFIISFDEKVQTADRAALLADQLILYFCNHYQVLWCVHFKQRGCSSFHVHIIINSVSYTNGKMYHSSAAEIEAFKQYAEFVLNTKVRWMFE
jgi:hypothetical protein